MASISNLFVLLALIAFALAAAGFALSRVNLVAAGLALYMVSVLL